MKKGFTLVELLAVIVILALLAVLAVPSAISIGHNIKKDMYCEKKDMILTNVKSWGNSHSNQLKSSCYIEKTVSFFVEEGVLKRENDELGKYIMNPVTNMPMDNVKIGIYLKNKRAYAFYINRDEELDASCDEMPVCGDGEEEMQDNKIVCVKRPSNRC